MGTSKDLQCPHCGGETKPFAPLEGGQLRDCLRGCGYLPFKLVYDPKAVELGVTVTDWEKGKKFIERAR